MRLLTMVMLCFTSWIIGCGEQANILMNQQTKTAEVVTPPETETTEAETGTTEEPPVVAASDDESIVDERVPLSNPTLERLDRIYGTDIKIPDRGTSMADLSGPIYGPEGYFAKGFRGKPERVKGIIPYVSESGKTPWVIIYLDYPSAAYTSRVMDEFWSCRLYQLDGKLIFSYFKFVEDFIVAQVVYTLPPEVLGHLGHNEQVKIGTSYNNPIDSYRSMRAAGDYLIFPNHRSWGGALCPSEQEIVASEIEGIERYYPLDDGYPWMVRLQVGTAARSDLANAPPIGLSIDGEEEDIVEGIITVISRPPRYLFGICASKQPSMFPGTIHPDSYYQTVKALSGFSWTVKENTIPHELIFRLHTLTYEELGVPNELGGVPVAEWEPDAVWRFPVPPSYDPSVGVMMDVDFIER